MSAVEQSKRPIPVQAQERIVFVDILRGFAVFGILVANMNGFAGTSTDLNAWSAPVDKAIVVLYRFFIEAKFYSLFSLLFGWGMAIQITRAEQRGTRFLPTFLRRLLILLCIGILHGVLIWDGDILTIYALYGVLLLLFRNRSERSILVAAGLFLSLSIVITIPGAAMDGVRGWYERLTAPLRAGAIQDGLYATGTYWEITQLRAREFLAARSWFIYTLGNVFGMFLLGLYIGKRGIFCEINQHLRLIRTILIAGLIVGVLFNGIYTWTLIRPDWVPAAYFRLITRGARTVGAPALMLFYVTSIILLVQSEKWQRRLAPLANVGRGALSNYLFQSVVCTLLFYSYGLGIYGEIDPLLGLLLTIAIFLLQIRLSEWWFDRFRFGPMERIWRVLTYGTTRLRAGEPSEKEQGPRFCEPLRQVAARVDPRSMLVGVWVVLVLWSASLGVWHLRLEASARQAMVTPVQSGPEAAATQVPWSDGGQAGDTHPNPSEEQHEIRATPAMHPVAYNPSASVAAGDPLALASFFDAEAALAQIEILTGPPYLGRYPASPEGWEAAQYIAAQFARFGLQPAGDDGTYFQSFPFDYVALAGVPGLEVVGPDGIVYDRYVLHQDYAVIVRWYGGAGVADGDVVWANACTSDELGLVETVGKILLCRTTAIREAERSAVEYGAAGLLLLTDPAQRPPDFGNTYFEPVVPEPIPTFRIFPSVVDELLLGSGMTEADLSISYTPVDLATSARMTVSTIGSEACPVHGCQARNVLGVIPGRDPEYADQVFIIGAHYDHLGQGPDGMVWAGANDNASGVAVMLEVARMWQEQGYVPRYTVLFAAWDAEEEGLLGSTYYVQHPSFALENTTAMIQFDMVGAGGDTLWIDGGRELGEPLLTAARALGVQAEATDEGRSDHVPFMASGIPANLLIWRFDGAEEPGYHRPIDTPDKIELEKLKAVGQITSVTLTGLMESEAAIGELLAERSLAIVQRDLEAYLDTSLAARAVQERTWFDDALALGVTQVAMESSDLRVLGRTAIANVQMAIEYEGGSSGGENQTRSSSLSIRFEHDGLRWRWAGPDLTWVTPQTDTGEPRRFGVAYPPGEVRVPGRLAQVAASQQAAVAAELDLLPVPEATILLYPDSETLRLDTALSLPRGRSIWVGSDTIKLVYSPEISTSQQLADALVQLTLAEAGVTEAAAPWLWQGLPQVIRSQGDELAIQVEYLPRLRKVLAVDPVPLSEATAWAAVDYLQQQIGLPGIGQLLTLLGQACRDGLCDGTAAQDLALARVLGVDARGFESAWQQSWRDRLADAQVALDTLLSDRTAAIVAGDESGFLSTVDPNVPSLVSEERHWFASIVRPGPESFRLSGEPVALLENGSILATISLDTGSPRDPVPLTILCTRDNGRLRWAGTPLEILNMGLVQALYPAGQEQLGQAVASQAHAIYAELSTLLNIRWTEPLTLKLYANTTEMLASISPHALEGTAVPEGGAVKLGLPGDASPESVRAELIALLARYVLDQMGVDSEWLLRGASIYLAGRFDGGSTEQSVSGRLRNVLDAVNDEYLFDLEDMPSARDLESGDLELAEVQAWDTVRYLVYTHGWEALVNLLHNQAQGTSLDAAVQSAIGQSVEDFEAAWAESLSRAHALPAWIDIANDFETQSALHHIDFLASPQLAGRQAGSPGAELAAIYIAEQFAEYGLQPLGDGGSFMQRFPISYTLLVAAPRLEITTGDDEREPVAFVYQSDFLTLLDTGGGAGGVAGELVWIQDTSPVEAGYQDVELSGRIVVRELSQAVGMDVVQAEMAAAVEHGAGGLILLGMKEVQWQLVAKDLPPPGTDTVKAIPVLELTRAGSDRFRDLIKDSLARLPNSPTVQPLGLRAQIEIPLSTPETKQTANILGLLPGSDPVLGREVIILGAHYDHVGDDPGGPICFGENPSCERLPGLRYDGANDDASGVGVLLEIARLWHKTGYRPQQSVLFAAWGAQELGELGSSYYVANPALPLANIAAMLQLDSVGGGGGYYLEAQGGTDREQLLLFNLRIASDWVDGRFAVRALAGQSDQIPFQAAGIPTLLISWREASEDDLPVEFADQVEPYRLGVTGRIVTLALMATAR